MTRKKIVSSGRANYQVQCNQLQACLLLSEHQDYPSLHHRIYVRQVIIYPQTPWTMNPTSADLMASHSAICVLRLQSKTNRELIVVTIEATILRSNIRGHWIVVQIMVFTLIVNYANSVVQENILF